MISIPFADDGPDLQALAQVLEQEANAAGIVLCLDIQTLQGTHIPMPMCLKCSI